MTVTNLLDVLESRLVPYATQVGLRQDFKFATQEANESIRVWALWVRTLGQRAYATLSDADREAIQRDQFVDGYTDSKIQESLMKEDIDGFGSTFERALRSDSINKVKQKQQRRRTTPVVRHAFYEDDLDFEFIQPSWINAVLDQGAVAAGKQKLKKQSQETQELVKHKNALLQQQNTVVIETLSRLKESIRHLWAKWRSLRSVQNNQNLFDLYRGDRRSFNTDQTATSLVACFHCHETAHWACACPKMENQDKAGTSGNHLN